jgi:hypothetical protein
MFSLYNAASAFAQKPLPRPAWSQRMPEMSENEARQTQREEVNTFHTLALMEKATHSVHRE